MKNTYLIHTLLLAIYPILFVYSENINQLYFVELMIPLFLSISITIIILLIVGTANKNFEKAGLIVSLIIFIFYFSKMIYTSFLLENPLFESWIRIRYYLIFLIIVFSFITFLIYRLSGNLDKVTKIINVFAIALIILSILTIFSKISNVKLTNNKYLQAQKQSKTTQYINKDYQPDIYYIILDAYARSDTLKELYNFNNKEFLEFLRQKGFYVASNSYSNYAFTYLSLSSSLNLNYIPKLKSIKDYKNLRNYIKNNNVAKFLKSKNYKYVFFNSSYSVTKCNNNESVDYCIKNSVFDELSILLIQESILGLFNTENEIYRLTVLNSFSNLEQISNIPGPKFVFCHIVCPHPPYLFGKNGQYIRGKKSLPLKENKDAYLDQLIFINKKVRQFIDYLLLNSNNKPVIIVQSDHGAIVSFADNNDWIDPDTKNLKELMGILNAYYLPYQSQNGLYKSISPVNTFRLIFNNYFNAKYPLLDDKSFYSNPHLLPFKFIDITDRLKNNQNNKVTNLKKLKKL
ncbi:MAG: hypothetical protein AB1782_05855 [Cyanobacteriota bacterium]